MNKADYFISPQKTNTIQSTPSSDQTKQIHNYNPGQRYYLASQSKSKTAKFPQKKSRPNILSNLDRTTGATSTGTSHTTCPFPLSQSSSNIPNF